MIILTFMKTTRFELNGVPIAIPARLGPAASNRFKNGMNRYD
jgi:hypothetical protein